MNTEELNELYRIDREFRKNEQERMFLAHSNEIASFKAYCKKFDVVLQDSNFEYIETTGIVAKFENLLSFFPEIPKPDKEGLHEFKKLLKHFCETEFNPGYLKSDKFILMPSTFFRRGYAEINNFAPRFIDLFWKIRSPEIDSYIALDPNRLGVNIGYGPCIECDTWYGPPFMRDIALIQDGNVKLTPPQDIEKKYLFLMFRNCFSLNINWKTKGNIKEFQAIEFKDDEIRIDYRGGSYHPARYIHAEYDISTGFFRHFDGAIQYYDTNEYLARRNSDFWYNDKSQKHIKAKSEKLFKFNGKISVDIWTEMASHYFASNPLLYEYFSGSLPDHVIKFIDRFRKSDLYNGDDNLLVNMS